MASPAPLKIIRHSLTVHDGDSSHLEDRGLGHGRLSNHLLCSCGKTCVHQGSCFFSSLEGFTGFSKRSTLLANRRSFSSLGLAWSLGTSKKISEILSFPDGFLRDSNVHLLFN